eukprot:364493-Chlamydomonas_euryale.AAC.6
MHAWTRAEQPRGASAAPCQCRLTSRSRRTGGGATPARRVARRWPRWPWQRESGGVVGHRPATSAGECAGGEWESAARRLCRLAEPQCATFSTAGRIFSCIAALSGRHAKLPMCVSALIKSRAGVCSSGRRLARDVRTSPPVCNLWLKRPDANDCARRARNERTQRRRRRRIAGVLVAARVLSDATASPAAPAAAAPAASVLLRKGRVRAAARIGASACEARAAAPPRGFRAGCHRSRGDQRREGPGRQEQRR